MSVEETADSCVKHGRRALPLRWISGSIAVAGSTRSRGPWKSSAASTRWSSPPIGSTSPRAVPTPPSSRRHAAESIQGQSHDDRRLPARRAPRARRSISASTVRDHEHHREPGVDQRGRLPMTLEPPLTEWLGDPEQPLPNTGQVGSMVPIARGVHPIPSPPADADAVAQRGGAHARPHHDAVERGMADYPEAELVGTAQISPTRFWFPRRSATSPRVTTRWCSTGCSWWRKTWYGASGS